MSVTVVHLSREFTVLSLCDTLGLVLSRDGYIGLSSLLLRAIKAGHDLGEGGRFEISQE